MIWKSGVTGSEERCHGSRLDMLMPPLKGSKYEVNFPTSKYIGVQDFYKRQADNSVVLYLKFN